MVPGRIRRFSSLLGSRFSGSGNVQAGEEAGYRRHGRDTRTAVQTHTGELSLLTDSICILTKSLRPLPEKWHGLSDVETRYRQRYFDLIVNPAARELVRKRCAIIAYLRNFLTARNFLEVETPMMQTIPGGATAKPFETFHHALNRELYLRIAPELYLKRLLVGGFDRVFEINRNFRNEGISTQHNKMPIPRSTELQSTYEDLMSMTEDMLSDLAKEVTGSFELRYGGRVVDMAPPWPRMTVREALLRYSGLDSDQIDDQTRILSRQ